MSDRVDWPVDFDALLDALREARFDVVNVGWDGPEHKVWEVTAPGAFRTWTLVPPGDPSSESRVLGLVADLSRLVSGGEAAVAVLRKLGSQ